MPILSTQIPSSLPKPQFVKLGSVLRLSNRGQLDLLQAVLERGVPIRMPVRGQSMQPLIQDRDVLLIEPMDDTSPRLGDVVAFTLGSPERLVVHRVIARHGEKWRLRGDNCNVEDGLVASRNILGRVIEVTRNGRHVRFGLGPERLIIAWLNSGSAWMRLKAASLAPKRAASWLVEKLQTLPFYRKMAKTQLPAHQITAAQPEEISAVYHRLYQAGIRHEHQPGERACEFVALTKKGVVGYLKYVQVGRPLTHWIAVLYVWPRYRGMGIGEALVRHVIGLAQAENARLLYCKPRQHETRILELLHKLGFQERGELETILDVQGSRSKNQAGEVTLWLRLSESIE